MKIAITNPFSWPEVRRGAERIVVETAASLSRRGHDVTVITAGSQPGRTHADGVTTIKLRRLTQRQRTHERTFAYRAVPYLIRGNYDVVHAMMAWDAYCATRARRLGKYRVVFDEMGIPYRSYWDHHPDGRLREYLAKHVDVYGCMSRHALDVLRDEWGREGALIPGGVRLDQFHVAEAREPVPTVLFSGALAEPRKGLDLLLRAIALVVADVPTVRVWLSGPGDPTPIVNAAPEAARRVVEVLPLGAPEEQTLRYQRAWVTALPSKSDSFGMVLIESLASGTPIVVLDDAAPPELVTPETGAIATPDDPASLAAALRRGFELAVAPETADRCRDFASDFDWDERIAPLLESLYEEPA
jgi:phosphatidylinositol alpha-mannosyltransferase